MSGCRVVLDFKEAKEACLLVVKFVVCVVDHRHYPADHAARAKGQKHLGVSSPIKGMAPSVEDVFLRETKLRNPMRVVAMQSVGQIEKPVPIVSGSDRPHLDVDV